ncbi:hypothetical protein [Gordonia sp. KTR9]|uniref:hypothetical protein n=1 Tax=Gordonia sp. KTR9 TaxID=337191 RepID=UPI000307C2E4|nr:hypothetical protein [Gordonia sp. KTR9]
MTQLTQPEGTDKVDPSELVADEVDFANEVGFYTDDPSTPALFESLTTGTEMTTWVEPSEEGLRIRVANSSDPVAVWDSKQGWVQASQSYPTRGDAVDTSEPTPLNLVYTLLSLGWRISSAVDISRISIRAIPPKSWASVLTDLAWEKRALAPASPVTIVLVRSDAGNLQIDVAASRVRGADGKAEPIDFDSLVGLALAVAPNWVMPDEVVIEPTWHSHGNSTARTSLPSDPYTDEGLGSDGGSDGRKEQLARWLDTHDMSSPLLTRTAVSEFIGERSPVGHYVLAFRDGSCYIGETVDFRTRFATHDRTYEGQIEAYHLRFDQAAAAQPSGSKARKRHLLNAERSLIHDAQNQALVARNFREMANPIVPSPEFTKLFAGTSAEQRLTEWFAHPDAVNASDRTPLQSFTAAQFGGAMDRINRFNQLPEASQITRIVGTYLRRCVPFPALTEYRSWSISCLPTSKRGTSGRTYSVITCLSISRTESLTILREDWSNRVMGFLQANEIEAQLHNAFGIVRLIRHHPEVSVATSDYHEFGPGTVAVEADSLDALERLLDDAQITRAASTSALRLCRMGPSMQRAIHNPYLVEQALELPRAWT